MNDKLSKEQQYVIGQKFAKVLRAFANAINYRKRQQAFAAYELHNRRYNPRPERQERK